MYICNEPVIIFRELDLMETVYVNRSKNAKHLILQPFQFLIVIDFESTCWENNRDGKQPEIIEFPAVLLNIRTGMIEEVFQQYVLPVENPILSDFCVKLTGIKQDDVENGMPLQTCLSLFCSWIKEISEKRRLVFHTNQKDSGAGNVCTFVTWSGKSKIYVVQKEQTSN
jgi:ERI1 exoribonuclease 2